MRKHEAAATTKLLNGLKEIGAFAYKIPDPTHSQDAKLRMRAGKRPFDAVVCLDGQMIAIECKYLPKPMAINPKALHEHQHEAMQQVIQNKGIGVVVVFYKDSRRTKMTHMSYQAFTKTITKKELLQRPSLLTSYGIYPPDWIREYTRPFGLTPTTVFMEEPINYYIT